MRTLSALGPPGGDGHFSLLIEASDGVLGEQVALKFYNPIKRLDPDASYRFDSFSREAAILERLAGERDIIGWLAPLDEFRESFSAGGISLTFPFAYYALELAETDVGSLIANGSMDAEQTLEAFHVMCRAVRRLHKRGYVHRDLKPPNFLLTKKGEVKLSDFGTARSLDGTMPALAATYSMPPGDLRYAAPEILAGLLDEDPRIAIGADIFALGAILFELVTGTVLGLHILDQSFRNDLARAMSAVPRGQRKTVFDGLAASVADGHPLPNLAAFRPVIPACLLQLLEDLYKRMSHLDYRRRLMDFDIIALRIQTCLLVLRNEEKYKRWRQQKERLRAAREAKLTRRAARAEREKRNGVGE